MKVLNLLMKAFCGGAMLFSGTMAIWLFFAWVLNQFTPTVDDAAILGAVAMISALAVEITEALFAGIGE